MKALCFVAHPDDCAIFGYHFIDTYKQFDWHIEYLTYNQDHERAREVTEFWSKRNVTTGFCNFPDRWDDVKEGRLGFGDELAAQLIRSRSQGYDIILTHNSLGEYGHPHHLFINKVMQDINVPKVYFGTFPDVCNKLIQLDEPPFDYRELPIHADIVKGFDLTNWKYFITPEAEDLLQYINGQ